ncbi:MAG: hypothetical protein M1825_004099 [Sarcosagium campestre]|nr:MAG: hypothetical protein M1825_004099 [Sarcosagium campestre]
MGDQRVVEGAATQASSTPTGQYPGVEEKSRPGQRINIDGKNYSTIKEGLAYILVPLDSTVESEKGRTPKGSGTSQTVFYNPIQQFNRDLSVLAIRAFGEEYLAARRDEFFKKQPRLSKKRSRPFSEAEQKEISHHTVEEKVQGVQDDTVATESFSAASESCSRQMAEQKSVMPQFRILDALSATGLRALRYVQEIPFVTTVTANDLSSDAAKSIQTNVQHNRLQEKIKVSQGTAQSHMYSLMDKPSKYHVIDLDPYGTAVPFLDAALQALSRGGLLCVTCTDAGVFASTGYPEKAFALYGGVSSKGAHSHEVGLRLILHAISTCAAKYGLAMEPLLSLSIDFYARVFVRIRYSPNEVKFLAGKTMLVYNCDQGCGSWATQPLVSTRELEDKAGQKFNKYSLALGPVASSFCEHCGTKTHLSGPMFAGPLHSRPFIERILASLPAADSDTYATKPRIEGMLQTALEEDLDLMNEATNAPCPPNSNRTSSWKKDPHPFFVIPSYLAKVLHCATPPENALRGALRHLGYRVTRSHIKGGSIKTNAPWNAIWDVMREWVRQKSPIKEDALREGSAGWAIMNQKVQAGQPISINTNGAVKDDKAAENNPRITTATNFIPHAASSKGRRSVIFDETLGASKPRNRLVRYQLNPARNWGPMSRARGTGDAHNPRDSTDPKAFESPVEVTVANNVDTEKQISKKRDRDEVEQTDINEGEPASKRLREDEIDNIAKPKT